jgi:hypothetical protein
MVFNPPTGSRRGQKVELNNVAAPARTDHRRHPLVASLPDQIHRPGADALRKLLDSDGLIP